MKTGYVYESRDKLYKEVEVSRLLTIARPLGTWAKKAGLTVIFISVYGLFWTYWPLMKAEMQYELHKPQTELRNRGAVSEISAAPVLRESITPLNRPAVETNYQKFNGYMIYIPNIGAESKVISNVDPFDKTAYSKALLEGVAEASNLSHPGETGTTYLFAHSVGNRIDFARYNAVFYLLDKLSMGDRIYIDYQGNRLEYEVENKEILRANDLKYFVDQKEREILVLQTCYPPGTSWKRLVVVGKRV